MIENSVMWFTAVFRLPYGIPASVASSLRPLKIGAEEIKFLREPLLQGCRFLELAADGNEVVERLMLLEFFSGSRFVKHYVVFMRQAAVNEDPKVAGSSMYNEVLQRLALENESKPLLQAGRLIGIGHTALSDELVFAASQFLRDSRTLTQSQYVERGGRFVAVEPKGIALFAEKRSLSDILSRYGILQALVRAYQAALDQAVEELASLCAQIENDGTVPHLSQLRRDSLVFAARFLFSQAVRLDTLDLRYVWDDLTNVHCLAQAHAELSQQLRDVHELAEMEQEKAEQIAEKRQTTIYTWLGLFITLLSLLALVELKPTTFVEFWQAWLGTPPG